jgi:hypothetical protein
MPNARHRMRIILRFVVHWLVIVLALVAAFLFVLRPRLFVTGVEVKDLVPALVFISVLVYAVYKISQGFYYAKLDVQVGATAYKAELENQVLLVVWLRVANLDKQTVDVIDAQVTIRDQSLHEIGLLGQQELRFNPVETSGAVAKAVFGPIRPYRLVGHTQEVRQGLMLVNRQSALLIDGAVTVQSAPTFIRGTWRTSAALSMSDKIASVETPQLLQPPKEEKGGDIPLKVT